MATVRRHGTHSFHHSIRLAVHHHQCRHQPIRLKAQALMMIPLPQRTTSVPTGGPRIGLGRPSPKARPKYWFRRRATSGRVSRPTTPTTCHPASGGPTTCRSAIPVPPILKTSNQTDRKLPRVTSGFEMNERGKGIMYAWRCHQLPDRAGQQHLTSERLRQSNLLRASLLHYTDSRSPRS